MISHHSRPSTRVRHHICFRNYLLQHQATNFTRHPNKLRDMGHFTGSHQPRPRTYLRGHLIQHQQQICMIDGNFLLYAHHSPKMRLISRGAAGLGHGQSSTKRREPMWLVVRRERWLEDSTSEAGVIFEALWMYQSFREGIVDVECTVFHCGRSSWKRNTRRGIPGFQDIYVGTLGSQAFTKIGSYNPAPRFHTIFLQSSSLIGCLDEGGVCAAAHQLAFVMKAWFVAYS